MYADLDAGQLGSHPARVQKHLGTMLGGGARAAKSSKASKEFYLCSIDLDKPAQVGHGSPSLQAAANTKVTPCDFLVHGLARSNTRPNFAIGFEKHGPGCALFDLRSHEVCRVVPPSHGREFYGHGCYTPGDQQMIAVESDLGQQLAGYLVVRDGSDLAIQGEFPSYGTAPHDLQLLEDGSTLVVSNGGTPEGGDSPPSIAYIELKSGKLLERIEIPNERLNAGHLSVARDGGLVVVSAPRSGIVDPDHTPGGVSIRAPGKSIRSLYEPETTTSAMLGESLSVAVDESRNVAVVTNPRGNLITFWDRKTGEFIKQLRVPDPRGVALTLDRSEFVVSFNRVPQFARIDANTLEATSVPGNRQGFRSLITGSHIAIWDL